MNDLQFEQRNSAVAALPQSKLLMNAFTFELARRRSGNGDHRELPPSRRGSDEYLEPDLLPLVGQAQSSPW